MESPHQGNVTWNRIFLVGLLALSFLLFAAVPVARWYLFEIDHQFANLAGAGLGLLGGVFGYAAVWTLFGRSSKGKSALLLVPLLVVIAGYSLFELVGFTGETVPVFRWRDWGKEPRQITVIELDTGSSATTHSESPAKKFASNQFLGPLRSGVVQNDEFSIAWDVKRPYVLWKIPIGAGWSGFVVEEGLAITLEQIDEHECLTAFNLVTGKGVWRHKTLGKHFHSLGGLGPRSTPTIHHGKVIAQTAVGVLICVELETGRLVWQQDLLKIAGIDQVTSEQAISWGRSGSPLVFESQVIVPLGGGNGSDQLRTLVAFDLETGGQLWTGGNQQISYASPVATTLCGVEQIVNVNEGSATGHDPRTGQVLWSTPWPSNSSGEACSSQPVMVDTSRVLLGKGYALGSKLIELSYSGTTLEHAMDPKYWSERTVWSNTRVLKTKFTSAIFYSEMLFGLSDGVLECIDPKDGSRVWRGKRYGQGQTLIVNGRILVLSEDGRIALVEASGPSAGKEIAEMAVLDGVTWNVPAVAGPYLLVRNAEHAACLISESGAAIK